MKPTPKQRREAAALLQELLPRARLLHVKPFRPVSALGRASMQHYTARNLRGVLIRPASLGGWHGDVLFDVPEGYSDAMGTPAQAPCRTREEAIDVALAILAGVLASSGDAPKLPPVAVFHRFAVHLRPDILDTMRGLGCQGYPDAAFARQRLDEIAAKLFPRGVTDPSRLPPAELGELLNVLHMASFNGVLVHPPHPDRSPSGHGPDASAGRH